MIDLIGYWVALTLLLVPGAAMLLVLVLGSIGGYLKNASEGRYGGSLVVPLDTLFTRRLAWHEVVLVIIGIVEALGFCVQSVILAVDPKVTPTYMVGEYHKICELIGGPVMYILILWVFLVLLDKLIRKGFKLDKLLDKVTK